MEIHQSSSLGPLEPVEGQFPGLSGMVGKSVNFACQTLLSCLYDFSDFLLDSSKKPVALTASVKRDVTPLLLSGVAYVNVNFPHALDYVCLTSWVSARQVVGTLNTYPGPVDVPKSADFIPFLRL